MTLKELVDLARRASPGIAPDIDDAQALSLLRAVCTDLRAQISTGGDAVVDVPVLGRFEIRPAQPLADAQSATAVQITFVPGGGGA